MKTGLPLQKAELLVRAAVALDILDRAGETVILGPHGAAMLGTALDHALCRAS